MCSDVLAFVMETPARSVPQVFSIPKGHPRSKPFHDHVLNFSLFRGRVIVRHYQACYLQSLDMTLILAHCSAMCASSNPSPDSKPGPNSKLAVP